MKVIPSNLIGHANVLVGIKGELDKLKKLGFNVLLINRGFNMLNTIYLRLTLIRMDQYYILLTVIWRKELLVFLLHLRDYFSEGKKRF